MGGSSSKVKAPKEDKKVSKKSSKGSVDKPDAKKDKKTKSSEQIKPETQVATERKDSKKSVQETPKREKSEKSIVASPPALDDSEKEVVAQLTPAKQSSKGEKNVTKATKGRLSVQADTSHLVSALESKEQARGAKLFSVEEEKHSKIYKALNPDKLWFESRREREEAKEDDDENDGDSKLFMRSDFGDRFQDAEGNMVVADEEEYEDKVPAVIPTFDPETEAELKKLRAEREEKLKAHQDKLRQEYLKKKEAEDAVRQAEIDRILKEEAAKKKKEVLTDADVKAAQKRLESQASFGDFKWQ